MLPSGDAVVAKEPFPSVEDAVAPAARGDEPRGRDLVARATDPTLAGELAAAMDPATVAQLASWFGLPSFAAQEEAAAQAPPPARGEPLDPDLVARRAAHERAIAAVDPAILASLDARAARGASLTRLPPPLRLTVDDDVSVVDQTLIARAGAVAEPREVEIPEALRDDLRECTPQAVLRDLHRSVEEFALQFEVGALATALPPNAGGMVREAMATNWHPPATSSHALQARALLDELAGAKRAPWSRLGRAEPDAAIDPSSKEERPS